MFGKGMGGIEQAFLDYNHALAMQGVDVIPVIHPKALVKKYIRGNYEMVANFSQYDLFAVMKIRKLIMRLQPTLVITHGARACKLMRAAVKDLPIIGIAHNYKIKNLMECDAIIAITEDLKEKILKKSNGKANVFVVSNMVNVPTDLTYVLPEFHKPVVIGTLSRLEEVKGIDIFIQALKLLKDSGFPFSAIIAGEGSKKLSLKRLCTKLGISELVNFAGWVTDKQEYWKNIDIFCFPSRHESFGIALIEALMNSKLIVSSKAEGPSQILRDKEDGFLVPVNNPQSIADAIMTIARDNELQKKMSLAAFSKAKDYSMVSVSRRLKLVLEDIHYIYLQSRYDNTKK
jgi:glycosyltransferase involved in cell wall biosynthesis